MDKGCQTCYYLDEPERECTNWRTGMWNVEGCDMSECKEYKANVLYVEMKEDKHE